MNFWPFWNVTVVIATDVTLYLLTVLDALKIIQCITIVLFFSEISIGNFWVCNLHIFTFQVKSPPSLWIWCIATPKVAPGLPSCADRHLGFPYCDPATKLIGMYESAIYIPIISMDCLRIFNYFPFVCVPAKFRINASEGLNCRLKVFRVQLAAS